MIRHTQNSLDITRFISENINNQSFHHHYHILYDIASIYPQDKEITYVEIGCYAGGSACLMLQRPNTKVISIDLGQPIPSETVHLNVNKLNKHNNYYQYLQGDSQTQDMVNKLKNLTYNIDILFIDGDHSYQSVINDFTLYEGLVNKGGYIVFDDYYDIGCPGTKIAIDKIAINVKDRFKIIGLLPNIFGARPDTLLEGNDYIIQKL
jgi:predicted O-methyltransferase YrrM